MTQRRALRAEVDAVVAEGDVDGSAVALESLRKQVDAVEIILADVCEML